MKKIFLLLSAALVLGTTFSSCNKKLKDELDELSADVDNLETQNANLQNQTNNLQNQNTDLQNQNTNLTNQVNVLNEATGANAPIAFSFSGTPTEGTTLNFTGSYIFKPEGYNSYMEKYADDEYYVYIERYLEGSLDGEYVYIEFYYNPITKEAYDIEIGNNEIYTYGLDAGYYYFNFDTDEANNTISINVTNFDFSTGSVAVEVTASSTADYTDHYFYNYATRQGYNFGVSTFSASFNGKMEYYDYSNESVATLRRR